MKKDLFKHATRPDVIINWMVSEYMKKKERRKKVMNMLVMGTNSNGYTDSDNGPFIVSAERWEKKHLPPNRSIACVLIAAPNGYEIVPENEKVDPKSAGSKIFNERTDCWEDCSMSPGTWLPAAVYARPIVPALPETPAKDEAIRLFNCVIKDAQDAIAKLEAK